MNGLKKSNSPGAAESNAGDEFHILWACQKALEMLNPQTTLRGIVVEGVSKDDSEDEDQFLVADLTEYYSLKEIKESSVSIENSDAVLVAQLKYSTRHPTKEWTASRLCKSTNKSSSNSIIQRFAQIFKGFISVR